MITDDRALHGLSLLLCLLATGCGAFFAPPGLARVHNGRGGTATCSPLPHRPGVRNAAGEPHDRTPTGFYNVILPRAMLQRTTLRMNVDSGDVSAGRQEAQEAQAALERVAVPEVRVISLRPRQCMWPHCHHLCAVCMTKVGK